jgi:hypothetical protein
MFAALLAALFTAMAVLAIWAIASSWRAYGAQALAIHGALRRADQHRAFEWTRRELVVRRSPATVRVLPVRTVRPALKQALLAAA